MRNTLKVGNVTLNGVSVYVLECNDDDAAEPDYEAISVPGRSGDLHIWNERWKNKLVTYKCACMVNAKTVVPALITQLLTQYGYQRIEDTFHPEYYKMGEYVGATTPVYSPGGDAAKFNLTFDCKPQKWLLSGEAEQSVSSGVILTNPTNVPAYPLFKIQGYGNLDFWTDYISVNKHSTLGTLKITDAGIAVGATNYLMYDCDVNYAYDSVSNVSYNSYARFKRNTFIRNSDRGYLSAGKTRLYWDNTMSVKIIPRWCAL